MMMIMIMMMIRFLYQVFPGTPDQCERLLRKSAKNGNLEMLQKLVKNILIQTNSN